MSKINEIIIGMQSANSPSDYWLKSIHLESWFPELEETSLIMQRGNQTVFDHTMVVLDLLQIANPVTLLGGLFHDLGKGHVSDHVEISVRVAQRRLAEWGASPYLLDRVVRLVTTHMYDIPMPVATIQEKTIRKFVASVRLDNVRNWFTLREADVLSYQGYLKYKQNRVHPFCKVVQKYLSRLPGEDNPSFPQLKPNVTIGGKDSQSKDVSLSVEGDE